MFRGVFLIVLLGLLVACKTSKNTDIDTTETELFSIESRKDVLFESTRNRKIPIVIYLPKTELKLPRNNLGFFNTSLI